MIRYRKEGNTPAARLVTRPPKKAGFISLLLSPTKYISPGAQASQAEYLSSPAK